MRTVEKVTINIRHMVRSDIDAVLTLNKEASGGQSSISYKDMIATDLGEALDLSFVAEVDGRVVGFVLARLAYLYIPLTEVGVIHAIVVAPNYQRSRIGSRLLSELLSYCHAKDIITIRVPVNAYNTELRRFVERLGFRQSTTLNYDKTFEK